MIVSDGITIDNGFAASWQWDTAPCFGPDPQIPNDIAQTIYIDQPMLELFSEYRK